MILAIYGDSISTIEYGNDGYQEMLREALKPEKIYNHAVSATCLADTLPNSGIEVLGKAENHHPEAEVVILWYGTNDWYFGNPVGAEDSTDEKTFYGALHWAINILKSVNPQVKILLPTANLRWQAPDGVEETGNALYLKNKAGLTQVPYIEAVKKVGQEEGCRVIDMQAATGFTMEEMDRYFPDGVHPSQAGYEVIAKIFAEAIGEMMDGV